MIETRPTAGSLWLSEESALRPDLAVIDASGDGRDDVVQRGQPSGRAAPAGSPTWPWRPLGGRRRSGRTSMAHLGAALRKADWGYEGRGEVFEAVDGARW